MFARFSFSYDPRLAELQMHAIIFYLTAFGYIDGDYDESERAFVRKYIANLVEKRADEAQVDAETRADVVAWRTEHFLEVSERSRGDPGALHRERGRRGEPARSCRRSRNSLLRVLQELRRGEPRPASCPPSRS